MLHCYFSQLVPPKPLGKKRSRTAKQKRHCGRSAFTKCATSASAQSLDGSDYSVPDNNVTTEAENRDNSEMDGQAAAPVEELQDIQHFYSVFLPSYLQSKEMT